MIQYLVFEKKYNYIYFVDTKQYFGSYYKKKNSKYIIFFAVRST